MFAEKICTYMSDLVSTPPKYHPPRHTPYFASPMNTPSLTWSEKISQLHNADVMGIFSSEARSELPSELYADDLVLMAPTIEQLGRRVAEWRASLLDKGLKVNAGKSKVMVGISGGKMIVNSGKWPCGKGVQANSVQCTVLKN